jgi:predicted Rossmann fold nucleotide-binding protein DprA/Smf involved in DNA uptake
LGNLNILRNNLFALFCSVKCPGTIILQAHDLAQHLLQTGITVAGGFHSPVERECLAILLLSSQPIIVCPARGIEGMRVPGTWRRLINEGRPFALSPFESKHRRIAVGYGEKRNKFVAAIADRIFVAYATPGGKTEQFCRKVISWGKLLQTSSCNENRSLMSIGARPVGMEGIAQELF